MSERESAVEHQEIAGEDRRTSIYPLKFSSNGGGAAIYLRDPMTLKLLEFFEFAKTINKKKAVHG